MGLIPLGSMWINAQHISSIHLDGRRIYIYMDNYIPYKHDQHPALLYKYDFASIAEAKKFVQEEIIPQTNSKSLKLKELQEQIISLIEKQNQLQQRLTEQDEALKYISGSPEYQQAYQDYKKQQTFLV